MSWGKGEARLFWLPPVWRARGEGSQLRDKYGREVGGRGGGAWREIAMAEILRLFGPDPLTPAPLRNCFSKLCPSISTLVK